MSVITKYVCDKCGHSKATSIQMWNVGIVCETYSSGTPRNNMLYKHLWCRRCLVKAHILSSSDAERDRLKIPIPETPPTFEEMLRDLIGDIVQENVQ